MMSTKLININNEIQMGKNSVIWLWQNKAEYRYDWGYLLYYTCTFYEVFQIKHLNLSCSVSWALKMCVYSKSSSPVKIWMDHKLPEIAESLNLALFIKLFAIFCLFVCLFISPQLCINYKICRFNTCMYNYLFVYAKYKLYKMSYLIIIYIFLLYSIIYY